MAAPFSAGPYDTDPACAPGGGPAITAVPRQPAARVAGLPAPPPVLPALPLRFLPQRAAALPRPDRFLRARRSRIRAVHREPALQLRQPQLQPPLPVPGRGQLRPQRRDLGILRLHHGTQDTTTP